MSTSSIDGLVSGLNTTDIITKLMSIEQQPQLALQRQVQTANAAIAAYQSINGKMADIGTAASALNTAAGWNAWKATSSNTDAVQATASTGAVGGSLSFTVNRLATAGAVVSSGTVSSLASMITSSNTMLLAKGGTAYGIASVAGNGLTEGAHNVVVTQSSAGATATGTPLSSTTTIDSTNNSLSVNIDGAATTLTIAAGTYTQTQLAAAVQAASGGALTASVDNSNDLVLATTSEGSAHSLQVTGGSALAALGLSAGAQTFGTDGILQADNGATVSVNDVRSGASATLTSDQGGSIAVTFSGGLRAGTLATKNVNVGDGSLGAVVAAVNNAGMGITATAIQTDTASYKLQLSSNTAGSASGLSVSATAFSGIGSMVTLVQAGDAQLTVGSGAGAFTVTSASNTVSNLLPGVTLNLQKADPATTVTVSVNPDGSGLADKIQKMVDAANAAVTTIQKYTAYDAGSKSAGVLLGDPLVGGLADKIDSAVANAVGASSLSSAGLAGVSLNNDGSISFDKDKFLTAYNNDPKAVQALFTQGATATDSGVSFVSAGSTTAANGMPWAVNVTTAASQAEVDGASQAGGVLGSDETISLRVGTTSVSYAALAGQSVSAVADGINRAMVGTSLGLTASVDASNRLIIKSTAYGSASAFDVESSGTGLGLVSAANAWETHAGTDVAGTINGVAATGVGQLLSAPATDPTLAGVIIRVTGSQTGARGTLTYTPGVAQRLASLTNQLTDVVTGSLTLTIQGRQSTVTDLGKQITSMQTLLDMKQQTLQAQFNALETSLSNLKAQGSYLSSQIANLGTG